VVGLVVFFKESLNIYGTLIRLAQGYMGVKLLDLKPGLILWFPFFIIPRGVK